MKKQITITRDVLFQLMHSHSKLSQAEFERTLAYSDSHFSAQAEQAIANELAADTINDFIEYVERLEGEG